MAAKAFLRRGVMYVPGSSPRFIAKSASLKADVIAYDLEDSVTVGKKAEARKLVKETLDTPISPNNGERAVRINSVGSGLALADLQEVLRSPNLTTLVVPKVESPSDLHFVTDVISHTLSTLPDPRPASSVSVLALIESAKSLSSLDSICKASPILSGLCFAAEDFALDLSITRTPSLSEFLHARSVIVTAARAHDLPSTIDLVTTNYQGEEGMRVLEEECLSGQRLGFNGKQVIHPSQLEAVQKIFSPSEQETEWAVRVVIADKKADALGRGAWSLDGKMIDKPVVGKAESIVGKAELCGLDVQGMMEKFKDEEPM